MKIYLMRHCESEDDILNCYGGCADFELTEKGIGTAKDYANGLLDLNIEKMYSSPYKRAKNVAQLFCNKINCDLEIVDDLREINTYGVMSGVNKDLAKELFAHLLNKEKYKNFSYYNGKSFEGGEDVKSFDNRVRNALDYIVGQRFSTVGIVSHSGVFRCIYKNILKHSEKILEIDDVATIEIDYNDGIYNVVSMWGIRTE